MNQLCIPNKTTILHTSMCIPCTHTHTHTHIHRLTETENQVKVILVLCSFIYCHSSLVTKRHSTKVLFYFLFYLSTFCSMHSLTRNWTRAPCSGHIDHQGVSLKLVLIQKPDSLKRVVLWEAYNKVWESLIITQL